MGMQVEKAITFGDIVERILPSMLWAKEPLQPLDWLALAFLVLLLFLGLYAVRWRIVPMWRTARDINRLATDLGDRYREVVKPAWIWDQEIRPSICKLSGMEMPWREFREACWDHDKELRNAHQSHEFFDSKLFEPQSMGFVQHVPALMTALGILGTFIGIAIGLEQIDLGTGATSASMTREMQSLTSALGVSFRTSIWGLIGSIFVTFLMSASERSLESAVQQFVLWLDAAMQRGTQQDLLLRMNELQEQQVAATNGLAHDLAASFEEMLNGKDGQGGIVGAFGAMQRSIEENQSKGVERMVDGFLDQLNNSMGDQFGSLGESMQQMAVANQSYQDAMNTVVSRLEEATAAQAETAGNMAAANTGAAEAVAQISDMLGTVSTALAGVDRTLETQRHHAEQQSAVAADVLEAARVQNEGWQRHQDAIQGAYKGLEGRFGELSKALDDLVSWHGAVKGELRDVVAGLASAAREQRAATALLATEREELSGILNRIAQLQETSGALVSGVDAVRDAVTSLMHASTVLGDAGSSFEATSQRLTEHDSVALEKWDRVQQGLEVTTSQMDQGMREFSDRVLGTLQGALNSFDEQLSAAVSTLGQAIFALQEEVERLEEFATHEADVHEARALREGPQA